MWFFFRNLGIRGCGFFPFFSFLKVTFPISFIVWVTNINNKKVHRQPDTALFEEVSGSLLPRLFFFSDFRHDIWYLISDITFFISAWFSLPFGFWSSILRPILCGIVHFSKALASAMHPLRVALPVLSDAFTRFLHMVIRRFSTFFGSGCREFWLGLFSAAFSAGWLGVCLTRGLVRRGSAWQHNYMCRDLI